MTRIVRITRALGLLFGGVVTLVGVMGLVGLVTDSFLVRLLVALLIVVGIPAFVSDRILKRVKGGGRLGFVGDVFAIVLLAVALALVAADVVTRPLFVGEGNRYARSGARTMARAAYFFGGVRPVFPEDQTDAGAGDAGTGDAGTGEAGAGDAGAADVGVGDAGTR